MLSEQSDPQTGRDVTVGTPSPRGDQDQASALTGTTEAAAPPGDRPSGHEAAAAVTDAIPPRCKARTRLYRDGHVQAEGFPADEISQRLADDKEATVWLDLYDPEIEDLAILTQEFGLHPLAVEDAVHDHERPKLDRYPDHLLLSAYAVHLDHASGELT